MRGTAEIVEGFRALAMTDLNFFGPRAVQIDISDRDVRMSPVLHGKGMPLS